MKSNYILHENLDGIDIIKINNPKTLNALSIDLLKELDELLDELNSDDSVEVIIITGVGKAFVAGANIKEMKDLTPEEGRKYSEYGNNIFKKIESSDKPIIAAINGYALGGGCELVLSCDLRISNQFAKFGQPEVGLGIIPGFGGTQRLSRIIGISKAKELIYTGKTINAIEAKSIGLVNEVVGEGEDLLDYCIDLAKQITKNSNTAVSYAKKAINRGIEVDIDTGILIENELFGLCFSNNDQKEGMNAFIERRKPNFKSEVKQ